MTVQDKGQFKGVNPIGKFILETLIIHLQERYSTLNIGPSELKSLLLFED